MAHNYGLTGLATIVSGYTTIIAADTKNSISSGVRIFDYCLINTTGVINLYSQNLVTGATSLVLQIDKSRSIFASNAGIRFEGNVVSSASAVAGNMAVINYIKEY